MKTSSCKRFTLIEMLVVIAIISILAGLVFPALGLARQNAKKSKANSECQSLKTAIIMYESEFSCWPVKASNEGSAISSGDYVAMCKRLTGENGKKMMFYEVGVGFEESKGILDPWGNQYQVILDTDFDGKIANSGDVATIAGKELRTRVAVFSFGVDRKKDNTALANLAKNKKIVTAW